MSDPRIVVALDHDEATAARALADRLDPGRCRVKIGSSLHVRAGPALVSEMVERGFDVFLDLKFHDIPNTVAGACRAAADLGVWMLNVHAAGGRAMMDAARASVAEGGPLLVAVTVLTSLDRDDLADVGMDGSPLDAARRLAGLAHACGLDGVVCSPAELAGLGRDLPADFLRVTPGIRPAAARPDDQKRTLAPADALRAGASYLVIGRPITAAPDPMAALAGIEREVAGV